MRLSVQDLRPTDRGDEPCHSAPVPDNSGTGAATVEQDADTLAAAVDSGMSVRSVVRWIDSRLEHWLISLFYVYLCLILVIEVALRALGSSIVWAVETSLYAFIWLTYVSAAQLARDRRHLSFSLVRDSLGRRGQFACLALSDLCLAVVCVVIAGFIWRPLADTIRFDLQMMAVDLPLWLAMVAVPFGWLLVLARVGQRFWRSWDDYRSGRPLIVRDPAT